MSYLETAQRALETTRAETPQPIHLEPLSWRTPEGVAAMSLDRFARAGLVVRVHSDVLDADVLFVSDNVPQSVIWLEGLPVYRASELRHLVELEPTPDLLRGAHAAKTLFGGSVTTRHDFDE